MILDANANLGESLYGPRQTVDELLRRMDAHGIDRAVVSPLTPRDLDLGRANACEERRHRATSMIRASRAQSARLAFG